MAWNFLFQRFLSLFLITTALAIDCSLEITESWKTNGTLTVEEGTNLSLTYVISPKCAVVRWKIVMAEEKVEEFLSYGRSYYFFSTYTCFGDCNVDCNETRNMVTCFFTTIVSRFRTRWILRASAVTEDWFPDPSPLFHWITLNVTYPPRLTSFTSRMYNESKAISTRSTSFMELVCLWQEGYPQSKIIISNIRTGRILSESAPAQNRRTQLNYTIDAAAICGESQWYTCKPQGILDVRLVELNVGCHNPSTVVTNSSDSHRTVWLLLNDSTVRLIAVSVSLAVFVIGCAVGSVTGILVKKSACCKNTIRKTKVSSRKITSMSSGTENVTSPPVVAEDASDDYEYPDLAVNARSAKANNYTDGCVHFRSEGDAIEEDVDYENVLNLNRR